MKKILGKAFKLAILFLMSISAHAAPSYLPVQIMSCNTSPTPTCIPVTGFTNGSVTVMNFPTTVNIGSTGTVGLTAGTTVNIGSTGTVGFVSTPYVAFGGVAQPVSLTGGIGTSITNWMFNSSPTPQYPVSVINTGVSITNWLFSSSPTPQYPVSVINSITVANLTPQVVPTTYLVSSSSALPVSLTGGTGVSLTNQFTPVPQFTQIPAITGFATSAGQTVNIGSTGTVGFVSTPYVAFGGVAQPVSLTGGIGTSITNWMFNSSPTPQYPVSVVAPVSISGIANPVPLLWPTATFTFTNTFTPTATPTGSATPTNTATATPMGYGFVVNGNVSTAQTIVGATAGYYNTLRTLLISCSDQVTNGGFYITDGTATLYGPATIGPNFATGVVPQCPIYSQGQSRPLIFWNSVPVSVLTCQGQYSIDLPGVK